jgi:hypothetical protein
MPPRLAGFDLFKNSVIDEVLEPFREDVLGNTEAALELAEARQPEEGIANNEQAPPVPEYLQGLADPAVHVVESLAAHDRMLAGRSGCSKQPDRPFLAPAPPGNPSGPPSRGRSLIAMVEPAGFEERHKRPTPTRASFLEPQASPSPAKDAYVPCGSPT